MDTKTILEFRQLAVEKALVYASYPNIAEGRVAHHFDLNQGELFGYPQPATVRKLVELARNCAGSCGYGEHNALLSLVADRIELDRFMSGALGRHLLWHRPYHVQPDPQKWVTLAAWLTEQGESPDLGPDD